MPKSLKALARANGVDSSIRHCEALLGASGHSIGVALAKQTLASYSALTQEQRAEFFLTLLSKFSPDPRVVLAAAKCYADDGSPRHLWALEQAAEPARQELLRRLNRAPGGTGAILRMREHLLAVARAHPELEAVDLDFHHLLSSWFNPGFLEMVHVSWRTPAELLERIVQHERVHEIQDWQDLRHRLQDDRRCFAFFHPALPNEPLIFVEVALLQHIPDAIAPLLDPSTPSSDPANARVAVFYSISNCQPGLRGVSLGNFLIKQVVDTLSAEFPRLRTFCTLSPIPGFTSWLSSHATEPVLEAIAEARRIGESKEALQKLERAKPVILGLCAQYLLARGRGGERTIDAVARFHLSNGACLERLNWGANLSPKGMKESLGLMVNYLYNPTRIEHNYALFNRGRNVASRSVRALLPRKADHAGPAR